MSDLNILIVGEAGKGKSTAARIITKALTDAGFRVELCDKDDMNEDRFSKCKHALQGSTVRVTCGNARIKETT